MVLSRRSIRAFLVVLPAVAFGCGSSQPAPSDGAWMFDPGTEDAAKTSSGGSSCSSGKIEVCHSEGNGSYHTLCISASAASAHEGHGDPLCACEVTSTVYPDDDGDGYGRSDVASIRVCAVPAGYVANRSDCADGDGARNPRAIEVCDGADNDCDGGLDDTDDDGDGFSPCDASLRDCDDFRSEVGPGAAERCDGIDEDCDGIVDNGSDHDGDGFSVCEGDCLDDDPGRFPIVTDGWMEHLCDPVLPNTAGEDALYTDQAAVLVDPDSEEARYKAWYRYGDTVATRIGYAYSADGLSWTKVGVVLDLGAAGSFDASRLVYPTVLLQDGWYHMWYAGYNDATLSFAIGYARSQDGIDWERVDSNPATAAIDPVLAPGQSGFDSKSTQAPSVLFRDGTYYMWYGATDVVSSSVINIALATSTDGVAWTKRGVVLPVVAGTWEALRVNFPRVVDNGEYFEMLYAGTASAGVAFRVGYATSSDGATWTRNPANPILSATGSGWNGYLVYSPMTFIEQDDARRDLYRVYLSGGTTSAGPLQTGLYSNYLPLVTIVAPGAGSLFRAADVVPVRVHVDDPREVSRIDVRLYDGSTQVAAGVPDSLGYLALPVKLAAGTHSLTVVARDAGGLSTTDTLAVTIQP